MKVLVIAGDAVKRKEVRDAVLEALQGTGECFTTSHKEPKEICLRLMPDLVVVCDYDGETHALLGFQSYLMIREIRSEYGVLILGDGPCKHPNYCQSTLSLQALVYMRHRELGGSAFTTGRH